MKKMEEVIVLPARKIWLKILDSQIETGTPYLLYKDHANKKSNQKILEQLNHLIYVAKLWNIQTIVRNCCL